MLSPHHHVRLGIQAVVQSEDGRILLIKREDFRIWFLPGGMLDYGEKPEEGACRETWEETGVKIELTGLLGIGITGVGNGYTFVYGGRPVGGTITTSEESVAVAYFAPDKLPENLPIMHKKRIQAFVNGKWGLAFDDNFSFRARHVLPMLIKLRDLRNRYILKRPTPPTQFYALALRGLLDGREVGSVYAKPKINGWETLVDTLNRANDTQVAIDRVQSIEMNYEKYEALATIALKRI